PHPPPPPLPTRRSSDLKPVTQPELLARVRSLLRIKAYRETVERQARELAEWNRTLEARVAEGVAQLEHAHKLRRFLPPQLTDLVDRKSTRLNSSHEWIS